MATKAVPAIGASRPRLVGDVLWLGFTAFVLAVILVIVCWPLSAELSVHNPPGAVANKPTASLTPGTSTGSVALAPLPAPASSDQITRPSTLLTPAADIGVGSSNLAPPSPTGTPSEPPGASQTPPDRLPQATQSTSVPGASQTPPDRSPQAAQSTSVPGPSQTPPDGSPQAAQSTSVPGPSQTPPDRSPRAAQSTSLPGAVSGPGTSRLPRHKPRARPVASKQPPQLTPW
jgi:hypothetical protein